MSTTPVTPPPAPVPLPVMMIPLMCALCGNRLVSAYNAQTRTTVHVHQVTANAKDCAATGKKYIIGASGVQEYAG